VNAFFRPTACLISAQAKSLGKPRHLLSQANGLLHKIGPGWFDPQYLNPIALARHPINDESRLQRSQWFLGE
jgi:hypothetical protein